MLAGFLFFRKEIQMNIIRKGSLIILTLCLCLLGIQRIKSADLNPAEDQIKVAIIQLVTHPSLDKINQGIKESLTQDHEYKGKITFINYNAEGDLNLLPNLVEKIKQEKPDLIFALTTPVAQALQLEIKDTPIILAGITDPLATGLVEDLTKPGANMSGVTDAIDINKHLSLMLDLQPHIRTLGIIYTSSDDSGQRQMQLAKETAEKLGLQVKVQGISQAVDLSLAAQTLSQEVDALYVGADNMVASAFDNLVTITDQVGIAIYPSIDTLISQGGLAGLAIDQKTIGLQAGQMGLRVLKGQEISQLPIEYVAQQEQVYNSDTLKRLKLQIEPSHLEPMRDISAEQ